MEPVLIAGEWRQAKNPSGSFQAEDPASKTTLPERYPVSGLEDVNLAVAARQDAVAALRSMPSGAAAEAIARFLEAFATGIEASADALCELAARETAYPRDAAPAYRRAAAHHQPAAPGRGGGARAFLVRARPSTPRPTCARITPRWAARSWSSGPTTFRSPSIRSRAETSWRPSPPATRSSPRRTPATRGRRGCSARCAWAAARESRPAAGHGAAHLPDVARRRVRAGVSPRRGGHWLHRQQERRPAS